MPLSTIFQLHRLVTSGIPLINKKYWKLKSVISYLQNTNFYYIMLNSGGCYGRDHMVVGFRVEESAHRMVASRRWPSCS
jgi:hypothetical protein